MYLDSTSNHSEHDICPIESGAPFHMNPHREWFCEYEKYNGGDVFLRDDSTSNIIGHGRVKLKLEDGRIRTLPRVLHIPILVRKLISIKNMDDASMQTVFEKKHVEWFKDQWS